MFLQPHCTESKNITVLNPDKTNVYSGLNIWSSGSRVKSHPDKKTDTEEEMLRQAGE